MIKPRIVRVFDVTCQRPVWQAWHTHADGTQEWIASSKESLTDLMERLELELTTRSMCGHLDGIEQAVKEIKRIQES